MDAGEYKARGEASKGEDGVHEEARREGGRDAIGDRKEAPRGRLAALLRLLRRDPKKLEERILEEQEKLRILTRQYEELRERRRSLEEEVKRLRRVVEEHERLARLLKARDERALSKAFQLFRDWFEETHEVIAIETLKRSLEKPPVWWQWVSLLLIGAVGGVGLGFAIAIHMIHGTPIPIHVVCR